MEDFTASNGVKVELGGGSYLYVENTCFAPEETDALREFFQHEADEKAGIWRSKIDPTWTAKVVDDYVHFHHEDYKLFFDLFSDKIDDPERLSWLAADLQKIAREYIEAHPEPKPWMDAKDGEAWVLTSNGEEVAVVVRGDVFVGQYSRTLSSSSITAGRRIWPDPSE